MRPPQLAASSLLCATTRMVWRASFRWRFQKLRFAARIRAGRSLAIRREVGERHSISLPPFIPRILQSSIVVVSWRAIRSCCTNGDSPFWYWPVSIPRGEPIRKAGTVFDDRVTQILGEAFDDACKALHDTGQPAIVAK
jgi:hypothetical protein